MRKKYLALTSISGVLEGSTIEIKEVDIHIYKTLEHLQSQEKFCLKANDIFEMALPKIFFLLILAIIFSMAMARPGGYLGYGLGYGYGFGYPYYGGYRYPFYGYYGYGYPYFGHGYGYYGHYL